MTRVVTDLFGVAANVISDKVLRTGAKVWICYCNGDAACPRVMGLAKNGHWCEKYTHYKRLENFRAKWIPEHLREGITWSYTTKDEAQKHADALTELWSGVRFFHSDGVMLRDGITEGEAFARYRSRHK